MTATNVRVQMQQRKDTAANWASANPTLLSGELGYETDTGKWKVGTGSAAWSALGYTIWSQISAYPLATADIADDAVTGAKLANNIDIAGTLDVTSAATFDNNVTVQGDLTVNGTTTTIDTTTLVVEDKNIEIGKVSTPTDTTADGGGITLKGATDKTINWVDATDAWTFSEHLNIVSGKEYRIAGTKVLDATSLGSAVVGSSLTSVGTIGTGVWNGTAIASAYIADSAITSAKITDGAIVDADINASAAIAGTKISPDFGSQAVTTTGLISADGKVSFPLGTAALPSLYPGSDTNTGIYSPGADQVAISTNGTQRLAIDSSGNVGIGTSSPAKKLEVASTNTQVRITDTDSASSGNCTLEFAFSGGRNGYVGYGGSNALYVWNELNSNVIFGTNNTERLRIDSSGRVGVGTSSPSEKLDVSGGNIAVGESGKLICSAGTQTYFTLSSGSSEIGYQGTLNFRAFNTGSPKSALYLSSGGNVGIGTTSPAGGLHVDAASGVDGPVFDSGGTGNTNHALLVRDSGNNQLFRVNNNGNVGIGTTSPASLLHLNNDATSGTDVPYFRCEGNSSNLQIKCDDLSNTNSGWSFTTGSSESMRFVQGSTERMRIDSSGRLLIGTTADITNNSNYVAQTVSTGGGSIALARNDTTAGVNESMGRITWYGNDNDGTYQAVAQIQCRADAAHSAGDKPGRIEFSTTADGASSPTERMRITSQGNMLLGSSGTSGLALQAYSTSNNSNFGTLFAYNYNLDASSPAGAFATATNSTATSNVLVKFFANGISLNQGQINANGANQVAFGTFSDSRLKENIVDLPSQWNNIKSLRPVEFDYIESQGGEHQIGFVAQEMQLVYPDSVGSSGEFLGGENSPGEERLTLTGWTKTEARLVKALQEAIDKIETLEQRLSDAGIA